MKPRRPNVLVLFSDQHQAAATGFEDHPNVLTPHLDQLAGAGTRFARAYCQDAVCVASRNSFFSGLYPRPLGCLDNSDLSRTMEEIVSLPSALQAAGYRTAAFGKRHLYAACDAGWDIKAGHMIRESPQDNYVDWLHAQGLGDAFDQDWAAEFGRGTQDTAAFDEEIPYALMSVRESRLPEDKTMEAWTRQRTIEFLRGQASQEQPFFCFSSFYRPHQPYTPQPRFYERFDRSHWGRGRRAGDGLAMPATLRQPIEELPPEFQEQSRGSNRIWRFDLARQDEQFYRDTVAAYYALVEEIDEHVGAILRALDESGQRDDTIVIYTSDHGDFVGAHGMIEKCSGGHNVYEETLRVPLVFRWPRHIRPGAVSPDLVELVDVYPTLLELCGIPSPALRHPLHGRSLTAALTRGAPVGRTHCVSENWSQATVITDRYKLGVWLKPEKEGRRDFRAFGDMLFDRVTDPHEIRNLAGSETHRKIESELRDYLRQWHARWPLPERLPLAEKRGA
jgi:arylsulfatase A-like enzyme